MAGTDIASSGKVILPVPTEIDDKTERTGP